MSIRHFAAAMLVAAAYSPSMSRLLRICAKFRRLRLMRVLLDTHTFIWWVTDAPALSKKARKAITDPGNECLLSLASCWEMAIKLSLGKLRLPTSIERFIPDQLAANAFRQLEIEFRHVARVATLAFHHREPFDRLLAAQALEERCPIISADPLFRRYGVKRIWQSSARRRERSSACAVSAQPRSPAPGSPPPAPSASGIRPSRRRRRDRERLARPGLAASRPPLAPALRAPTHPP